MNSKDKMNGSYFETGIVFPQKRPRKVNMYSEKE